MRSRIATTVKLTGVAAATVAATTTVGLGGSVAHAADTDIRVTEVAPLASSGPIGFDWIELTNTGSVVVDVQGWRVDDSSNQFGNGGPIQGITAIAPHESVILVVEASPSEAAAFAANWYSGGVPSGLRIGSFDGSGLGLSSGGDGVNVFNDGGQNVVGVSFGANNSDAPKRSFDNTAGASGAISTLSSVGVNQAFTASSGQEVGSPGIATLDSGGGSTTTSSTTTTPPPAPAALRVTEVAPRASSTGLGKDWVELTNTGTTALDITNWRIDDGSATFGSAAVIEGVTSIPAGGSVVVVHEVTSSPLATFANSWFGGTAPAGFTIGWLNGSGLGLSNDGDGIAVFDAAGALKASITFGVAPSTSPYATFDNTAAVDGVAVTTLSSVGVNGAVLASAGGEIGSPGVWTAGGSTPTTTTPPAAPFAAWPGSPNTQTAENYDFGADMSGLDYETTGSGGVLWASRNKAGTMFRLLFDGTNWMPDTANGWSAGKELLYPSGVGHPDSEGITFAGASSADGLYIASERNNDVSNQSRNSILRYDVSGSGSGSVLTAAQEWNLTGDLPATGANLGLEAVTWVPDTYLTTHGFVDESTGLPYVPADYPGHGDGVFFMALEATGDVYAYVLATSGTFQRLATIETDLTIVTDLEYDADTALLWVECDNTCNGRLTVLEIGAGGHYGITARYERPANLGNNNNEGFAVTPASSCVDGLKPVFWSDDDATGGASIIEGWLSCVSDPPVDVPEFPVAVLAVATAAGLVAVWYLARRPRSAGPLAR